MSNLIPYGFFHYLDTDDDITQVNYYKVNQSWTNVSRGPQIYYMDPSMYSIVQQHYFKKRETRVLQTFEYLPLVITDLWHLGWTSREKNTEEHELLKEEAENKQANRKTKMGRLW